MVATKSRVWVPPRRHPSSWAVRSHRWLAVAAVLLLLLLPLEAAEPGWSTLEIAATGSYARVYLPASGDRQQPAPLVIYLHGAGARPEHYERFVEAAAEAVSAVLVLPKSLLLQGWGAEGDATTIAASQDLLEQELLIDPDRIGIGGHSSGGAFAYLLTYDASSRFCGVFSMAAPFVRINQLAGRRYVAPIRLYYGEDDPNYTSGSYALLMAQWLRLDVPVEIDIRSGHGHSSWPPESMEQGLRFLTGQRYAPRQEQPRTLSGRRAAPGL